MKKICNLIIIIVLILVCNGCKENNNLDDSITFHTLRHSYATEFIKNGGDIWELKNILGHSSINTTSIYLHMAENFKDVYSPLNEVCKHA